MSTEESPREIAILGAGKIRQGSRRPALLPRRIPPAPV